MIKISRDYESRTQIERESRLQIEREKDTDRESRI